MNARDITNREIQIWKTKNSYYDDFFGNKKIQDLIKLCEIATQNHHDMEKKIVDFIAGLALLPIQNQKKDTQHGEKINQLMKPAFDIILKQVSSDEYQKMLIDDEVSDDEVILLNGLRIPISKKAIELHIRRTNSSPITKKDIANIQSDFVEYKKKQYSYPKQQLLKNHSKENLTISQVALMYVYLGLQITRENGNEIAEKYGHKSGDKLFQKYSYYSSLANRKGEPKNCTELTFNNKIKLFESVIELLPKNKQDRAKDEVSILKKIFEAKYI